MSFNGVRSIESFASELWLLPLYVVGNKPVILALGGDAVTSATNGV